MRSISRLSKYLSTIATAALLLLIHGHTLANQDDSEYPLIEWIELMPEDDLNALLNPPEYLNQIEDGSEQDQLENASELAEANDAANDRYQQALVSTRVKPEYDKKKIKVPGFVVPLSFNDDMIITEFFLVPFFGACIHVPPPPPNQMIHVNYEKGLALNSLYDPYVIEGTLNISTHDGGDMGTAAYAIAVDKIYLYE
jgi:hypothetical protein